MGWRAIECVGQGLYYAGEWLIHFSHLHSVRVGEVVFVLRGWGWGVEPPTAERFATAQFGPVCVIFQHQTREEGKP